MKKIYFIALLLGCVFTLNAQTDNNATATLKSASRLFATKDDLTSVIQIIPADSVVTVLDSDSTYFHVVYDNNEGYIFKRQAVMNEIPVTTRQSDQTQSNNQQTQSQSDQDQQQDRFSYLENKYGSSMAAKLMSGKIWKGMSSEMVSDSWGTAEKINRIISGNTVKEEWIFRNTWLYFENNTLLEWGPVKKQQ